MKKIPGEPETLQAEGPDGMSLGEFGLKKNNFVAAGMLDALLGDGELSHLWEFGIPVVAGMGWGWGWDIG